jgi:hypothetical protein
MLTLTSYKLVPAKGDTRTLDQRLEDHMKEVKTYGEKQAIANRVLDGTLIEYSKEDKE